MEKILGLDLGTNSIGWAIREANNELENQIIDKGVLTFDKGVAEDKSGEHPMVQKRTESRGKRRNYQAEKYRKWELLMCLIENKMCPLSMDELNEWRHYKKGVGRKYPQSKKFINWLRFDFDADGKPDFERLGFSKHESYYLFRALIVDESKVEIFKNEPQIIGRVLYQLVQRRGYNDGQNIDENEKDELSKTIMKGGGDAGAVGVNDILPYIEKHKTLGSALYHLQKEQNVRIRKRYNLRSHFENEIKEICRVQGLEHLFKNFWGSIVWQRPLRSQKGLVGVCTFEQNKRRCPISHPLYEEYRTWVFINNLKIKPITEDETKSEKEQHTELLAILKDTVYPQFFKAAADFKLSSIAKELKKKGYEITARFPDDTKIISLSFLYRMKDIFSEGWEEKTGWNDILNGKEKNQKYNIEDLWHLHFVKKDNKETGETAFDFLKSFGVEKLKLDNAKAETFAKIRLQQGYATLSLSAIKKILPYLRQGFIYSEAIYLANLQKVIGVAHISEDIVNHFSEEVKRIIKQNSFEKKLIQTSNELINDQLNGENRFGMDANYQLDEDDRKDIERKLLECFGKYSWGNLDDEDKIFATTTVSNKYLEFLQKRIHAKNIFEKTERLHDKIFNWIKDTYNVPGTNIDYLWHPSEQETYRPAIENNGKHYLGTPEPISKGFKNPMALKTLYKLKKLINYLIAVGKIDEDTRVVIEIARELNDANKRKAIERWQRDKEKENDTIKNTIDEINKECKTNFNREDKNIIDKIRLWEEQKRTCIYTGKTIGLCDVLNGVKYDYEHSIPASMSFDNELKNLTIADSYYNREIKKKKIPFDCPNYDKEYVHNGVTYPSILYILQTMFGNIKETEKRVKGKIIKKRNFEKIIHLEELLAEWKAKTSEDKQIKDNIIIRRHLIKMELDYWRYKLHTFTTTEYKAGWRNSQLRDTQIITKYALPFLKTVFNKVDVQKGSITADFRKIFKIQNRLEKKERTKHSHHAIDAAVLTLIPPSAIRDKILFRHNEANENKQDYHETPRQWNNFHQQHIIGIEDDVLINYQADHRTLTPTYKILRKRGKVQFVKEKMADGKWQYKLDKDGRKIPLAAQGDSIRGQLHKESFFGAIKNKGELNLVERYPIAAFTSINDCKNIVDDAVKEIVKEALEKRMSEGLSFDKAKLDPVPFPNGKAIIKKVRCKVTAGRGYLTPEKAIEIQKHNFLSKHVYKQHIYAQNDQNIYCLFYESSFANKVDRAFRIIGLFELSKLGIRNERELFQDNYYNKIETGRGINKKEIPLLQILKVGTKVIFYKEHIEELKELPNKELLKRVFRIYKFNEMGTPNLFLQNHLEARKNELLDDGDTSFNPASSQYRLKIKADKFNVAIENRHFEINPDGEINWKV
jgi:CRISPR-associated endonuclease Csn1